MTNDTATTAPAYRYITTDLLTNRVLADIPFQGVSWGRNLSATGAFSGQVPINEHTASMNLFNSTMAAKTALYVVRDGKCVWGGIIWNTDYSNDHILRVSATEFPSFLNRREIWRDFSHRGSATLRVSGSNATLTVNRNTRMPGMVPGAYVHLEFAEEAQKEFSGFFEIDSRDSDNVVKIIPRATFNAVSFDHTDGRFSLQTRDEHGWEIGDFIDFSVPEEWNKPTWSGSWRLVSLDPLDKTRMVLDAPPGTTAVLPDWTEGDVSVSRAVPDGLYEKVTAASLTDTYDYVRYMIQQAMVDFLDIARESDPTSQDGQYGVTTIHDIVRIETKEYSTIIHTREPHNLSLAQWVTLQNVRSPYNGSFNVMFIPSDTSFEVANFQFRPSPEFFPRTTDTRLTKVSAESRGSRISGRDTVYFGEVSATTAAPHNASVGDYIEVFSSASNRSDPDGVLKGRYRVSKVTGPQSLTYEAPVSRAMPEETLTPPTFTHGGKTYDVISVLSDSDTTTVRYSGDGTVPTNATGISFSSFGMPSEIQDISYNKPLKRVWVETTEPHRLQSGDNVTIKGVQVSNQVWSVSSTAVQGNQARVEFTDSANWRKGDIIEFSGVNDVSRIVTRAGVGGRAVLTLDRYPWFSSDKQVSITGLIDSVPVSNVTIEPGKVTFTVSGPRHSIEVGVTLGVGVSYQRFVTSFQVDQNRFIFRTPHPHNFIVGSKAQIKSSSKDWLVGEYTITGVTDTEVYVSVDKIKKEEDEKDEAKLLKNQKNMPEVALTDTLLIADMHPGTHTNGVLVTATTPTTITVETPQARNVEIGAAPAGSYIHGYSLLNGTHNVHSISGKTVTLASEYPPGNHAAYTYKVGEKYEDHELYFPSETVVGRLYGSSNLNGTRRVAERISNAVVRIDFPNGTLLHEDKGPNTRRLASGVATSPSRFNGTHTITVHSPTEFFWSSDVYDYSIRETPPTGAAFVTLPISALVKSTANGGSTGLKTLTFSATRARAIPEFYPAGRVTFRLRPVALSATAGPYPHNAGIEYEVGTTERSGVNKVPPIIHGHDRVKVTKALDEYTSDLDGFNWRFDVDYDPETSMFSRTLVFTPNLPPQSSDTTSLTGSARFGAEKVVFEHPGNISKYSLEHRGADAVTRLFMVGRNPWGTDVPAPTSVAVASDLLSAGWPVLDGSDKNASTYDKGVLYNYARRQISERRPPQSGLKISVNGSLEPSVGTYAPGDWCSIVINDDPYIAEWMRTDQEVRDGVVIRRIEGFKVKVPDGTSFPETVDLDLVAEWEVSSRGN